MERVTGIEPTSRSTGATRSTRPSVPSVHFHDLRHTGNTLTAHAGATLSNLMARMGHETTRAARIYLHTTSARDRVVADALGALVESERKGKKA